MAITTQTMQITSDVTQKLQKIRSGNVFASPTVCVTELLQNSYRAHAKRVDINLTGNTITFADDGRGCRSPKPLLTLDYSEWESTTEGFGIGFWSVLAIPGITECRVASRTWQATIDVEKLFSTGTPQAAIEEIPHQPGFMVTIVADYLASHAYDIGRVVRSVGELQPFDVYFNGSLIPKKDLFAEVYGDHVKTFSTRLFDAKLCVSPETYKSPILYYEKREVAEIPGIYGVTGVVEMKPGALNLREPDRRSYSDDDKADRFMKRLQQCQRELYIEFIKNATEQQINEYAHSIDMVLTVSDYERYVMEGCDIEVDGDTPNTTDDSEDSVKNKSTIRVTSIVNAAANANPDRYTHDDVNIVDSVISANMVESAQSMRRTVRFHTIRRVSLKEALRKAARKVWMNADEMTTLAELKARAEYYKIKVFVAQNILQRRIYQYHDIPHIREIEDGIVRRIRITDVSTHTKKEDRFLALLAPICEHYHLPVNTFAIGKIRVTIETRLRDKLVNKTDWPAEGVCHNSRIILDRRALNLKRFRLAGRVNDGLGKHELKALMATLPIISHELSHLLKKTNDNTVEQFKTEQMIYKDIVSLYIQ